MTAKEKARRVKVLTKYENKIPVITVEEAEKAGLPLNIACAMLDQETGGGTNEFGHDPVRRPQIVGGPVTRVRYLRYKLLRRMCGMQGVGPCQLTWYSYQDAADKLGGCWQPRFNCRIGFETLAANIKRDGVRLGIEAYNGSGAAAIAYANSVLAKAATWKRRLKP